jgi:hypothetical protein
MSENDIPTMRIWDKQKIEPGICYKTAIGPLAIWVQKIEDEIHIANVRENESLANAVSDTSFEKCEQFPAELHRTRYISETRTDEIRFLPVMPDRAVLVRPEEPLKLPPGRKATFYVRIPVWVKISIPSADDVALCEIPTVEQCSIWAGDAVSGQLCYSVRSKARRKFIDFAPMPHRVICPILIQNRSKEMIDIERICVQSQHLNIYAAENIMWTNDIEIIFQTEDNAGTVQYSGKPSELKPDAKLLSMARVPKKKTLLKRSLGTFRIFGGY